MTENAICTSLLVLVVALALLNTGITLFACRAYTRVESGPRFIELEDVKARLLRLQREMNVALEDARSSGWEAWVRGVRGKVFVYLDNLHNPTNEIPNGDEEEGEENGVRGSGEGGTQAGPSRAENRSGIPETLGLLDRPVDAPGSSGTPGEPRADASGD